VGSLWLAEDLGEMGDEGDEGLRTTALSKRWSDVGEEVDGEPSHERSEGSVSRRGELKVSWFS
jgi:hypothetical protein